MYGRQPHFWLIMCMVNYVNRLVCTTLRPCECDPHSVLLYANKTVVTIIVVMWLLSSPFKSITVVWQHRVHFLNCSPPFFFSSSRNTLHRLISHDIAWPLSDAEWRRKRMGLLSMGVNVLHPPAATAAAAATPARRRSAPSVHPPHPPPPPPAISGLWLSQSAAVATCCALKWDFLHTASTGHRICGLLVVFLVFWCVCVGVFLLKTGQYEMFTLIPWRNACVGISFRLPF